MPCEPHLLPNRGTIPSTRQRKKMAGGDARRGAIGRGSFRSFRSPQGFAPRALGHATLPRKALPRSAEDRNTLRMFRARLAITGLWCAGPASSVRELPTFIAPATRTRSAILLSRTGLGGAAAASAEIWGTRPNALAPAAGDVAGKGRSLPYRKSIAIGRPVTTARGEFIKAYQSCQPTRPRLLVAGFLVLLRRHNSEQRIL